MRGKKISIVFLLSSLIIVISIWIFASFDLSMNDPHAQVKKHFLNLLQQSFDNNMDGISYRTHEYELNG